MSKLNLAQEYSELEAELEDTLRQKLDLQEIAMRLEDTLFERKTVKQRY